MGEADVGDMAAVAVILVAWCLERRDRKRSSLHSHSEFVKPFHFLLLHKYDRNPNFHSSLKVN